MVLEAAASEEAAAGTRGTPDGDTVFLLTEGPMRTDSLADPLALRRETGTGAPAAGTAEPGRLQWADAAKGVCIVLVVLHHLTTKHYDLVAPEGVVETIWLAVTDGLKPVRMPLFFLISGMFAASAVRRPWRDVARRRLATPYYVYVVWLLIHAVVFSYATALPMNRTQNGTELVQDLFLASTQLWYLYALAVYFIVAKLALRLDSRVVLVAAGAVSAVTAMLPIEAANTESVFQHFVFFLAGVIAPSLPRRIAELRGGHVTGGLAAATVAAWAVTSAVGLPQSTTTLLVSLVSVPLAIRLVVAASALPWFSVPAAALGRQTLPIYVLHVPLLSLLHHVVVQLPAASGPLGSVLFAVYPLVGTAAVASSCLVLHKLLERGGLGTLFRLPALSTRAGGRPKVPNGATLPR